METNGVLLRKGLVEGAWEAEHEAAILNHVLDSD